MDNEDTSVQPEVPPNKDEPELGEECEARPTSNSSCEGDAGEEAVPEQTEECECEVKPSPSCSCEAGAGGEAVPERTEDCEVDGRSGSEETRQEASPEVLPRHFIRRTRLHVTRGQSHGQRLEVLVRNAVEALMDGFEQDAATESAAASDADSEDLLRLYTTLFAAVVTVQVARGQRPEECLPQTRAVVDEVVEGFKRDGRYPDNGITEVACRSVLGVLRRTLGAREALKTVKLLREEPAVDRALTRYLQAELKELQTQAENQSPRRWRTALKVVVFVTSLLLPIALWTLTS